MLKSSFYSFVNSFSDDSQHYKCDKSAKDTPERYSHLKYGGASVLNGKTIFLNRNAVQLDKNRSLCIDVLKMPLDQLIIHLKIDYYIHEFIEIFIKS